MTTWLRESPEALLLNRFLLGLGVGLSFADTHWDMAVFLAVVALASACVHAQRGHDRGGIVLRALRDVVVVVAVVAVVTLAVTAL